MTILALIALLVFVLNIPFGYWRANVKQFSVQWFLAIHLPVPFIIALRLLSGIGFAWYTYVFLVGAFFLGQRFGSVVTKWVHKRCNQASSCLVMDLIRCSKSETELQ
ncbi:MAG: hypothetical protein QNK35_04295 [Bacteroides sp.]|nr:hypothetical protein [Bacteroides sp.]